MLQNSQNDYSKKTHVPSYYKYARLNPQLATPVTITTDNPETIFEIAPRVFNLSRSCVRFTAVIPSTTDLCNFIYNDLVVPFRQVSVYTRGGTYLMDINNIERYTQITMKSDRMKDDIPIFDREADTGYRNNRFGEVSGTNAADGNPFLNARVAAASTNPYEPQYLIQGAAVTSATPSLNVTINFGEAFKNTILALDKDLYLNEIIEIRIVWNTAAAWGFKNITNNTNVGADDDDIVALTSIPVLNLNLYLALQANPLISSGLINKVVTEGMNVSIPYVHAWKTPFAAADNQNVSIRLGRAQGKVLKKIYHGIYHGTEGARTRYLHSNLARTYCEEYYVTVDDIRRSEFNINVGRNEDWIVIKDKLKGTCLDRLETYRKNWFILEDFANDPLFDSTQDTVDSGMTLDIEHKIDFLITTGGGAHYHYTYAVVTKDLIVSPAGIVVQ